MTRDGKKLNLSTNYVMFPLLLQSEAWNSMKRQKSIIICQVFGSFLVFFETASVSPWLHMFHFFSFQNSFWLR